MPDESDWAWAELIVIRPSTNIMEVKFLLIANLRCGRVDSHGLSLLATPKMLTLPPSFKLKIRLHGTLRPRLEELTRYPKCTLPVKRDTPTIPPSGRREPPWVKRHCGPRSSLVLLLFQS